MRQQSEHHHAEHNDHHHGHHRSGRRGRLFEAGRMKLLVLHLFSKVPNMVMKLLKKLVI
jgi:hypothetical protein